MTKKTNVPANFSPANLGLNLKSAEQRVKEKMGKVKSSFKVKTKSKKR